ncbi:MAG: hypothetical protein H0X27_05900 [Caulobacteraceae bacterium]|nr:hypothetical protein [Caulobacteraceae bacterium]
MNDHSRILAYIAACRDKDELSNLMANARRQGARTVEDAAFRRLVAVVPDAEPGSLEHDFWTVIQAFELVLSQERRKTVRLSRTRQKVKRVGVAQTLADFATGKPTEGFAMLKARGMLELSGEAVILKHPAQFAPAIVNAARVRLASENRGDSSAGNR